MIETHWKETCPACLGTGLQTNRDGIKVICPVCNGRGFIWKNNFDNIPPNKPVWMASNKEEK